MATLTFENVTRASGTRGTPFGAPTGDPGPPHWPYAGRPGFADFPMGDIFLGGAREPKKYPPLE